MDRKKTYKTKYQGVFYRHTKEGLRYVIRHNRRTETLSLEEASNPSEARKVREERISLGRAKKKEITSFEENQVIETSSEVKETTLETVFKKYEELFKDIPGKNFNDTRKIYQNRLRKRFKNFKVPSDFTPYLIKSFTNSLYKEGLADATIKHHLVHLNKLLSFAAEMNLCSPIDFKIEKPKVSNEKTEDLTKEELERLKNVLENYRIDISTVFWIAMYTGFRKKSILNLKVKDLDFNRKLITLRTQKNNSKNRPFPMSGKLEVRLEEYLSVVRPQDKSVWLFPMESDPSKPRVTVTKQANKIRELAGLPEDFRPLHGLRHVYASTLASSGKVGMQTLQRLLDHKDYKMTSRYSHLRDEALRGAVDVLEESL